MTRLHRLRPFLLALVGVILVAVVPPGNDSDDGERTSSVAARGAGPGAGGAVGPSSLLSPEAGGSSAPSTGAQGALGSPARRTAVTAAPPGARIVAPPAGLGIGTAEALGGPDCDPATGRIKVPFKYAPPCVRPWPEGADNGGATSMGVTDKEITVVAVGGSVVTDTNPDRAEVEQAFRDILTMFFDRFQTWGRKLKMLWRDFGPNASPDETQQRAMAIDVANLKPFMVVAMGGGPVFQQELAGRKVMAVSQAAIFKDTLGLAPYLWQGIEPGNPEPLIGMAADYIAKRLIGRPARWAGDAAFQSRPRKFGLIYLSTVDQDLIRKYFSDNGVPLAVEVTYGGGAAFAEQVRTIVAKLKDGGVTTVINATDLVSNPVLTKEATNQLYFPEWFITGTSGMDITLGARLNDQQQWRHAFGYGPIPPVGAAVNWMNSLIDWYYGPDQPPWREGTPAPNALVIMQLANTFVTGLHMAGPSLTPFTFRDGMFAYPPSGGVACGCVTMVQISYGRNGGMPGYDDYFNPDDVVELWWDADNVAPDELGGITAPGYYRYMNGGRRAMFGTWAPGEPRAFDPNGTIDARDVQALPPSDRTPAYPCTGCPSAR